MTRWNRWIKAHIKQDGFPTPMAYLRAREDAQTPRHPIHQRLYMRWIFRRPLRKAVAPM